MEAKGGWLADEAALSDIHRFNEALDQALAVQLLHKGNGRDMTGLFKRRPLDVGEIFMTELS